MILCGLQSRATYNRVNTVIIFLLFFLIANFSKLFRRTHDICKKLLSGQLQSLFGVVHICQLTSHRNQSLISGWEEIQLGQGWAIIFVQGSL